MEEIEKRLRDATDACLASHAEWSANKKDGPAREKLQEAVHELRKVAARLEIEVAISERDEMSAKPIPIPPHRASKRRPGEMNDFPAEDDSHGNQGNMSGNNDSGHESGIARTMRRRRPGGPGQGGAGQGPREGGPREGGRDRGDQQPRENRGESQPREGNGNTLSTGTLSAGGPPRTQE